VGYPVVAKPDTGVGAAQTFKIDGERELEAFLLARPQVDYIVEEFISAPMVTYDGLADRQGRVVFETSFEYGRGVMEVVNQDAEITYTILRDIPADLVEAGRAIVEAFGVRERFFHFEFFRLPSGGLVALEVNVRPPGGFTVDMWNYQGDLDMYREWGNLLVKGRMEARATRPYFVTWVGRKDRFRYAASQAELRDRLGPLLVHHTRGEDIFSRAIGNEGFILRSPEREPLREAAAAIQEKA
jgi:biotin carboxylase